MIRIAIKLTLIFVLVYAGVYILYGRIEKELLLSSVKPVKSGVEKTTVKIGKTIIVGKGETVTTQTNSVGETPMDFQIIVKRNIFEAILEPVVVEPVVEVVEEVVPTALNLTLLGTVTGNNRTARAIIIDNSKKKQDIYQIGDAVQGAFIEAIERGKVTLEVNGKMEALMIKDREGGGPGPPKMPTPRRPRIANKNNPEKTNVRKAPIRPNRRISFRSSNQEEGEPGAPMIEPEHELALEQPELPGADDVLPPLE